MACRCVALQGKHVSRVLAIETLEVRRTTRVILVLVAGDDADNLVPAQLLPTLALAAMHLVHMLANSVELLGSFWALHAHIRQTTLKRRLFHLHGWHRIG